MNFQKCGTFNNDRECINAGCVVYCGEVDSRYSRCFPPVNFSSLPPEMAKFDPTNSLPPLTTSYIFLIPTIITSIYVLCFLLGLMFRLLKYPSKDSKDNMLVMQADFSSQYYYTPYSLIRKVFKRHRRLFFFDFCRVAGLVLISVGYLIVYNRKDDACLYKSSIGYVKMELFISGMVLISIGCLRIVSVLIPQPSRGRLKKVLSFSEYIETVRANIPQIRYHAHCYGREMVETEYGVQEHDVTVHSDSYSFKLSSEDKSIIRDPPKFGLIVLVCDRKLEWGDNATREHYETTLLNFHGKCKTSDISTERTMLFLYDCGYDSENKLLCYSTKLKPWYLDRNFYLFMSIIGLGYFYEMWLEWISQEMHITFKKVIRFEIE